jgi:hypothetical protein
MAGLTVPGDPYAWLDAGRSISTLMMQLERELPYAGGPVIDAWRGPAANAFTADWTSRRSRYEDLISHARTAAKAITAFGEKLHDLIQQAANLESTWCGLGLQVMETGAGFMLPPGVDLLPAGTQLSLHQALAESRTAVEKMASDAVGAAEDLTVALGAAIAALEDFELIAVGAAAGYVAGEFRGGLDALHKALDRAGHVVEIAGSLAAVAADDARMFAAQISSYLREGADGERSAAGKLLPEAGRDARAAVAKANWLKGMEVGIAGLVTGIVAVQVVRDARRQGVGASLEEHAGDIASTATADALLAVAIASPGADIGVIAGAAIVAAGAPAIVGVVGGVVVTGAIAWGVGFTVQQVVDHRKAIEHFAERMVADL